MGSWCLLGAAFQVGEGEKIPRGRRWGWLHSNVNELQATKPYTSEGLNVNAVCILPPDQTNSKTNQPTLGGSSLLSE